MTAFQSCARAACAVRARSRDVRSRGLPARVRVGRMNPLTVDGALSGDPSLARQPFGRLDARFEVR
jgi:hypothetical protein